MQEIFNYLENSTLIANVVSFVVLGITGVLMRSIIVAIARIAEQNKDIDEKQGLIKNLATIAKITYQTSLMYKNAIINSNLTPEAKNQALEIFNEVQTAYNDLLPILEAIEGKVEEQTSAITQAITEQFTQIGQDALSQLRDKLK
jgi:Na+-transporting NADH:ubiquinone oxidoreductase subunit NqrC